MLPLTPITLAFAQELAVRAQARPDITLLEALENILRDRPTLDAKGFEPVCAQINDLVDITTPPGTGRSPFGNPSPVAIRVNRPACARQIEPLAPRVIRSAAQSAGACAAEPLASQSAISSERLPGRGPSSPFSSLSVA